MTGVTKIKVRFNHLLVKLERQGINTACGNRVMESLLKLSGLPSAEEPFTFSDNLLKQLLIKMKTKYFPESSCYLP